MNQETPPKVVMLLSRQEAADALSIGVTKLDALLDDETIPCVRIGTRRLVRVTDLQAFVDSLPEDSGSPAATEVV